MAELNNRVEEADRGGTGECAVGPLADCAAQRFVEIAPRVECGLHRFAALPAQILNHSLAASTASEVWGVAMSPPYRAVAVARKKGPRMDLLPEKSEPCLLRTSDLAASGCRSPSCAAQLNEPAQRSDGGQE